MESAVLLDCLKAGFIDNKIETDNRFLPKILTNDSNKNVKVLDTLLYHLEHCDEFFFSVAFITNSGVACLADILKNLADKNIKGKILASQYLTFTEPRALRRLIKFPNLEIKMINADHNFHAKGYLFTTHDVPTARTEYSHTMIIGSSNLTQTALTVNREWNVELSSLRQGSLVQDMMNELNQAWVDAEIVDDAWIDAYEKIYEPAKKAREVARTRVIDLYQINPNKMQVAALKGIQEIREAGKDRALLISATGTGKTYLSAFDARIAKPKKFLFIVHRGLIARKSRKSYEKIFGNTVSTGLLTEGVDESDKDFVFATIQTLVAGERYKKFAPDYFDYIVVDEAHHAGAGTYQTILDYFKPKFLLGMTATPERTDGYDIFKFFNYNIAYEIRLHQALEENMLVPFHYHGISEIEVNGHVLREEDLDQFNELDFEERVKHVLKYADFYGCDQGRVKGIVFCSKVEESRKLCKAFNNHGKQAATITGDINANQRANLIERLEKDDIPRAEQLDYLIAVDVLNEGVDIPSINQVILLRPTESAIVYVQQLGRGLRKDKNKRYLEVIDFIGEYKKSFLMPIALFGDRSYNREKLRRTLHAGSLPGASTVYIDDVAKEIIYNAVNTGKLSEMKKLKESYQLVKMKLGRVPMMMDFIEHGDIDPYLFVKKEKSYYDFRNKVDAYTTTMSSKHIGVLRFISIEIANGKRLDEIVILQELIEKKTVSAERILELLAKDKVISSLENIKSAVHVLTMKFFIDQARKNYGDVPLASIQGNRIALTVDFAELLNNEEFKGYVVDALAYGKAAFLEGYNPNQYYNGMKLYSNYTRKDVCRILNWDKDTSSTVYGYRVRDGACPMFVTYNKSEDISESTKYEDCFMNPAQFSWMTRNRVREESSEVVEIKKESTLKLLFVQKNAHESEFYFMGPVEFKTCRETTQKNDKGENLPIVNIVYDMNIVVDDKIYKYFEGESN